MSIVLKGGAYRAVVNEKKGASLISLTDEKRNVSVLREPPVDKEPDNPYIYGMPLLFPVNRISDGKFYFENRRYTFPVNEPQTGCHLHGELHKTPFICESLEESCAVFKYEATKDSPYLSFPHPFEIRILYGLSENGLIHKVTLKNNSDLNMPYFLGWHTTFNIDFGKNGGDEVFAMAEISEEYERNMKNYLPTGNTPAFDEVSNALSSGEFRPLLKKISRHYRAGGMLMKLIDRKSGVSVVYENDEKYKFRLIYNGGEDGYICMEPQTCLADAANSDLSYEKSGFSYLAPEEEIEFVSKIKVVEGDL